MKRYSPSTFRPAFGIAAAAFSAVTLSIMVVLPLGLSAGCPADATLATARLPIRIAAQVDPVVVRAAPQRVVFLEPLNVVARRQSTAI